MGLQSNETSGVGQSAAETEEEEHIVDDSATLRPTFTPAPREAPDTVPDDDMVPEDVDAQTGMVAEPTEPTKAHAEADDLDEPVEASAAVEAGDPARDYANAKTDEAAPGYEAPAEHETAAAAAVEPGIAAAAAAEPTTATPAATSAPPAPVALAALDEPLFGGDSEMLARWQRVQLGFIDDPQAAVAGAASLVEEAGRALAEALEQRQRQMRTMWDHGSADKLAGQGAFKADTEQLRQAMRRYHALFNQLCQPV